jgi:NarL family two-component system response regulator LiaR
LRHTAGSGSSRTVDGRSTIRTPLSNLRPDVVLVDEMCQRTNAISRLREISREWPDAKLILLSTALDPTVLDEALDAGA